jgi:hypothetical protein
LRIANYFLHRVLVGKELVLAADGLTIEAYGLATRNGEQHQQ